MLQLTYLIFKSLPKCYIESYFTSQDKYLFIKQLGTSDIISLFVPTLVN
jgi:hypothetical protein